MNKKKIYYTKYKYIRLTLKYNKIYFENYGILVPNLNKLVV